MRLVEEARPVAVIRSPDDGADEPTAADITTEQTPDESDEQTRDDANAITPVAVDENSPDNKTADDQQDHESHE